MNCKTSKKNRTQQDQRNQNQTNIRSAQNFTCQICNYNGHTTKQCKMVTRVNAPRNIRPPVICHTCNKARHISRFCRTRTQGQGSPKKVRELVLDPVGEVNFVKASNDASMIWSEKKKDKIDESVLDASAVDAPSTSG